MIKRDGSRSTWIAAAVRKTAVNPNACPTTPPRNAPRGSVPQLTIRKLAMTLPSRWFGTMRWRIEPKIDVERPVTAPGQRQGDADGERVSG